MGLTAIHPLRSDPKNTNKYCNYCDMGRVAPVNQC